MTGDDLTLTQVSYVVGRPLVDRVSVTFRPGRMAALAGPSGSGKTTLVSLAGGLLEPTSGEISCAGRPMWRGSGDPRPEVGYVLQVYGLVPVLSAVENVAVALRARGSSPRDAGRQAEAALEALHIADLAERQVEELSGGQLQRVALARGLAPRPRILFADEPTSELDEANRGIVMALLRERADDGAIVVVATHDPLVAELCDDRYLMQEGVLSETASGSHSHGRHQREAPAGPHPSGEVGQQPGLHPGSSQTSEPTPDRRPEPDPGVRPGSSPESPPEDRPDDRSDDRPDGRSIWAP